MALYSLDGRAPVLPKGFFFVAESAQVIGHVVLEEGAGIWFGAVLRGDNEPIVIGAGSNIQENSVLHTDPGFPLTVGKGCTIGHAAILHGCSIGDNSLVGMGATVLNGAKIGENCLIGAGALVTEGKVIPDNSLVVGAPARVVKTLDAEAAARLRLSAEHYLANARRFATGLERID
ncbi:gamma carbonic anhydrase family protein [Hoeflea olei]|uniref:Gamma carbonic anhydrase family protein n=1 Tax=Hoeflea olei TaxID=1480615 RepID=A0A1C1YZB6_9HYPH|nr:gamma carbonic anhydrase family protein [Hoeflea olei]OCW58817.1 gamma carbonic anhydrase family protein [Hoeflea olei]